MSTTDLFITLALTAYAVFQQTRRHQLNPRMRFKLAIIYSGIGVVVGGLSLPHSPVTIAFFAVSLIMSVAVGWVRGSLTRVWSEKGTWYSQGTVLTVSLFLAMIASKFALGTVAYFMHVPGSSGMGEVLIMIGAMLALQAQIIHVRARRMARRLELPEQHALVGRAAA